jgi:hypothetical protein
VIVWFQLYQTWSAGMDLWPLATLSVHYLTFSVLMTALKFLLLRAGTMFTLSTKLTVHPSPHLNAGMDNMHFQKVIARQDPSTNVGTASEFLILKTVGRDLLLSVGTAKSLLI